ncbi:hypothetical protein B0H16DRAFT_1464606 [Mycena metata]|uniref:Ubiquitin-like domain-containing protein n=1 Tax=Mycena metata TaxID=1033252 RepID=A0AAD7IE40_9AGAR|nr:hypothetical protein B0H16DRAFT_1464606 [Mycena metata]
MPVFALAYGSLGDFVTTIELIVSIVNFMRADGAPSHAWTETEDELKALCNQLTYLRLRLSTLDPLVALQITQEVVRCHSVLKRFSEKIKSAEGWMQKFARAISAEKVLAGFKRDVVDRRIALGVLIGLMNLGGLSVVGDRVKEISGQVEEVGKELGAGLAAVNTQVEEVGKEVEAVTSQVQVAHADVAVIGARVNTVGVEVRRGHDLIRDAHQSLAQLFANHQAQMVSVITHLPRGVAAEVFVVLSPTGVYIPIPIVYCTSYEDMDRILKTYICGGRQPGSRYVAQGNYRIISPDGKVVHPAQFITAATGNVCLEMSIVKSRRIWFSKEECPQCQRRCRASTEGWREWMTVVEEDRTELFRRVHLFTSKRLGNGRDVLHLEDSKGSRGIRASLDRQA